MKTWDNIAQFMIILEQLLFNALCDFEYFLIVIIFH